MEEKRGLELVHRFFHGTGTTYDRMVNLCTFGFDRWWKRKMLNQIPEEPTRVIDQACGTGILTFKIARKFPHCQVIGVDLQEEYLEIARRKAKELRSKNTEFILGRAEHLFLKTGVDCVTSSYLAKYADLEPLVRNIHRMLRREGVLIMHDFTYPSGRTFSKLWHFYFKILQTAAVSNYLAWSQIFHGLPDLLRDTRWVSELVGSLKKNGFADIRLQPLTLGTSAIVTARKI